MLFTRDSLKNIMQRKVEDKDQKKYTCQILNQASIVILMTMKQNRIQSEKE